MIASHQGISTGLSKSKTLLLVLLIFVFGLESASAHQNETPKNENVILLKDRLRDRKPIPTRELTCAQLLLGKVSPLTQFEIAHKIIGVDLPLHRRIRKMLKLELHNPLVQEFMESFTKNASRLAAVMTAIPEPIPGDRNPTYNSLRALMIHQLELFIVAFESANEIKIGTPARTYRELIVFQKHISVLADLVEELEKSLPKSFVVSMVSEELAAFLFQSAVSPLYFDEKIFVEKRKSSLVSDFYFEQFNYRMSPIMECAPISSALNQEACRAFKPVREEVKRLKKNSGLKFKTVCTYEPKSKLCAISEGVAKAALLGVITERIYFYAYGFTSGGRFGNGPRGLFDQIEPWMQGLGLHFAGMIRQHEIEKPGHIAASVNEVDNVFNQMIGPALKAYAYVRLLQGPSYINENGYMVQESNKQKVEVSRESADRVVLPYFKELDLLLLKAK